MARQNFIGITPNLYREQADNFMPIRIIETEIGQPLPNISAFNDKTGQYYQRAFCIIRLHTYPLGTIELQLDEQGLSADAYAERIWSVLYVPIVEHLQEDGLPPVTGLDADGLSGFPIPKCVQQRELFLQTAPFVSVIVSTRDRPECLALCLDALMKLHYPCYEVIVVDNAPATTATADLIKRTYSDELKIKYVRENRQGLSLARNRGMTVARGEILAFTDDDIVVDACWLIELVKAFSYTDKVACVTGLVLPLELETQAQAWFEGYGGLNKGFTRRIFDCASNYTDIPPYPFSAGRFGVGANMAFTSAFLRSVEGFDSALGAGTRIGAGEDLAMFFQVITNGYRLIYEPTSLIYHLHRRDYAGLQKQVYHYRIAPTAILTKFVLENPLLVFRFVARVPYILYFILSSWLLKSSKKPKGYLQGLVIVEMKEIFCGRSAIVMKMKGMFYGPFAYVCGLWDTHRLSEKRCHRRASESRKH